MQEYSFAGSVDRRPTAFEAIYPNGSNATYPYYKSHTIYNGKPKLKGLPATYVENDDEATTLEVVLRDDAENMEFTGKGGQNNSSWNADYQKYLKEIEKMQ